MLPILERAFVDLATRVNKVFKGLPVGGVTDAADQLTFDDAAVIGGYVIMGVGLENFTYLDFSLEPFSEPLVLDDSPAWVPQSNPRVFDEAVWRDLLYCFVYARRCFGAILLGVDDNRV